MIKAEYIGICVWINKLLIYNHFVDHLNALVWYRYKLNMYNEKWHSRFTICTSPQKILSRYYLNFSIAEKFHWMSLQKNLYLTLMPTLQKCIIYVASLFVIHIFCVRVLNHTLLHISSTCYNYLYIALCFIIYWFNIAIWNLLLLILDCAIHLE